MPAVFAMFALLAKPSRAVVKSLFVGLQPGKEQVIIQEIVKLV